MLHRSMQTTRTASRQAGVAPASQYAASSAVRPCTWPSSPCWPGRSKKQVCHLSASTMYSPVCGSAANRARPRRCSSMPRCATGAAGWSSSGSAAAANASCTTGQEIPACRAASAGVIPRSVTSCAACSRSRAVIRHRGGRAGTDSVNVLRGHSGLPHLRRTLTQRRSTVSSARRTSRGRVITVSCTRSETVPQSGHAAAASSVRDRPHLDHAARRGLHLGNLQALHPEQRRRRILEHDARGFLLILKSVGRPRS